MPLIQILCANYMISLMWFRRMREPVGKNGWKCLQIVLYDVIVAFAAQTRRGSCQDLSGVTWSVGDVISGDSVTAA